jgi:hypothetical protein
MVRTSEEAVSVIVLSLAFRFFVKKRIDLYNKSCVMGDYPAQFCERFGVKFPLPTRCPDRLEPMQKQSNQAFMYLSKMIMFVKNEL